MLLSTVAVAIHNVTAIERQYDRNWENGLVTFRCVHRAHRTMMFRLGSFNLSQLYYLQHLSSLWVLHSRENSASGGSVRSKRLVGN